MVSTVLLNDASVNRKGRRRRGHGGESAGRPLRGCAGLPAAPPTFGAWLSSRGLPLHGPFWFLGRQRRSLQAQDRSEQRPRYCHLGQLAHEVAPVAHDAGASLREPLAKRACSATNAPPHWAAPASAGSWEIVGVHEQLHPHRIVPEGAAGHPGPSAVLARRGRRPRAGGHGPLLCAAVPDCHAEFIAAGGHYLVFDRIRPLLEAMVK
jgi:hypothetical protein